MFIDPLVTQYRESCELVGLCDTNPGRMEYHNQRLVDELKYHRVQTFAAEDFDRMIKETKPDTVIVCTVDGYHHQYITRAMELGCDAITEKPMTIDDAKCRAIFDAIKKTGKQCRVTFNYRWGPGPSLVRKLLSEGIIGEIVHVDLEYLLNTSHGADYFRRWHREKDKSGGLMVHKSTHHFDLVNWWINAVPETVFGMGRLAFYGRENARKRGVEVKSNRYYGTDISKDPFALDLTEREETRKLYLEAEKYDGYIRDRNVFGDNITIEDTMSVMVKYRTNTTLNYSLNAYLPREGIQVVFNGTKGRLEYEEHHGGHVIVGASDKKMAEEMHWDNKLIVHPMFGTAYKVEIPTAEGGHGGGDPLIQEQMFSPNPPNDPLKRNAGHEQGAASILIGIAANQCFKSGLPVKIRDLCPQLPEKDRLSDLI